MEDIENLRFYDIDGQKYPSVTTILSVLPKPASLVNYINNFPGAEYYTARRAFIGSMTHFYLESFMAAKYLPGHKVVPEKMDFSHMDEDVSKILDKMIKKIKGIVDTYDFEPLWLEKMVYSHDLKIAGRVDYIGRLDGKLCILDLKTSKRFYPPEHGIDTHALQLSAYAACVEDMGELKIESLFILRVNENNKIELKEKYFDMDGVETCRQLFYETHGK